ncbi:MAG: DUF4364 family protein [Lachnospiraceae bacterium]|nr:DUF4364 family protein [Lachnospiraceae bacterium]
MTEPLTLYKLIVLYMLDQVDFALTKSQIFDFILEKDYTNYFTLNQAASELIDSGLVESRSIRNSSHLFLTDEGRDTLQCFQNRISDTIKEEISTYFHENELKLRNEVSVLSNYYRVTTGEYVAELIAKEKNAELMNLKISMPSEDAAKAICENWQKKNQEIYGYLMEHLL